MSALPQASALSFVTYLPVRRITPYANRSQPRRPTEGPVDENSDAIPRSSRSLPGSNQRNQNRRRNPQQRQPTSSVSQSASDLFGFFDGEENVDQDISTLAQKRPERPRSRRRESVNDSKGAEGEKSFEEGTAKPDGDSAGIDEDIILEDPDARDDEPIDIDDNVDGGFFSKYRKEAGPGQRVMDYSSLDAQEGKSSEGGKSSQEDSSRRMDRETAAANAFDAVDKLFGSINLGKQGIMKKGVAPRKQKADGGKGTGRPLTGQIDRAKWLADLKARASTKGARDLLAGEGEVDSLAVDVNAVDDDSSDNGTESVRRGGARNEFHPAMDDRFEEAEIGDESEMNNSATRKSGFKAQKRAVRASESSEDSSTPRDGEEKQDTTAAEDKSDGETSFQKLMDIAREGPTASTGNRWKQPRSTRPSMFRNQALRNGNPQKRKEPEERKTTREPIIDERPDPPSSNISRILGLTKQIVSRQADAPRDKDDDSYEALDDEMEESISIRGDAVRKGSLGRQKFTAVRRVANRSFKIHKPPDEWKPMTEEEITTVRSDGRSFAGRVGSSKGKGIVANCQTCRGSGLDTCSACLGSGWVPPLDTMAMSESRKELLENIWNRPNLCVDKYGEAQCILCNGIGKQFCDSCKGSGSSLRKGFSMSEKREIFDLDDPEEDDSCFGEDEYADSDEDDLDEYEADEAEEYQLYTGPEKPFNFHRTSTSFNNETGDGDESDDNLRIGNDDELEVDDESAELLATLEAMHLADLEERGPEYMGHRKRRSEVKDRARDVRDAGFDLDLESDEIMDVVSGEDEIEENMKMTELDDEDDLDDDLGEDDDDLDNDDEDDLDDDDDDEDDLDDDIDDDRIVNEIESRGLELNLDDVSGNEEELE